MLTIVCDVCGKPIKEGDHYIEVLASHIQMKHDPFSGRKLVTKEWHLCMECWEKRPCFACPAQSNWWKEEVDK